MIQWHTDPSLMSDADLLAEYNASEAKAGDARQDALAAEIARRNLDV